MRQKLRANVAVFSATVVGALMAISLPFLPASAAPPPPVGDCSPAVGNASPPVGDLSRPGNGYGDPNHCHTGAPGTTTP